MPTFELALLVKSLPRTELVSTLKRAATAIFDEGGVIRKMENLGVRPTPYKISAHGATHKQAHYFIFTMDIGKQSRKPLIENYVLDIDVIRCRILYKKGLSLKTEREDECDLDQDLLPPPYRPSVQAIVSKGERRVKQKFKYNSGMNYYPFQR